MPQWVSQSPGGRAHEGCRGLSTILVEGGGQTTASASALRASLMDGVSAWLPPQPTMGTLLIQAWSRLRKPRRLNSGTQCWRFPCLHSVGPWISLWPGLGRAAAWAMCRMLKAGMEEEFSFPSVGGCEFRSCREGMLWMLGSAVGFVFGIRVSPGYSFFF